MALKSGINEDGWRVGRPTENVVIRHIKGFRSHGGIVIGSDMSGDVRNIYAHDCEFDGADRGIRLKSNASRGGIVEKIWYENIEMKNIRVEAIRINTHYGAYLADKGGKAYPVFRDITIKNVNCDGAEAAVSMEGTSQTPMHKHLAFLVHPPSLRASEGKPRSLASVAFREGGLYSVAVWYNRFRHCRPCHHRFSRVETCRKEEGHQTESSTRRR